MPRSAVPVRSSPVGFFGGLRAFAGGIGFILSTPQVWGYALVPFAMVLVLMCGLAGLGIWGAIRLGDYLIQEPAGISTQIGLWLLNFVLIISALLLAILLSLGLAQPLSSFALLAIVDAQEQALTGYKSVRPEFVDSLLRTLWVTLFSVLVCVLIFGLLLVVDLLFPPAVVVTVPLKFLVCAWLLAWNFLDYPLGLRHMGVGASLGWMSRHFGAVTSFGAAWAMLIIVPGLVLVLLPMGVAGATRLVVASEQ